MPSGCLITASSSHPSAFYLFFYLSIDTHTHHTYTPRTYAAPKSRPFRRKRPPVSQKNTPRFARFAPVSQDFVFLIGVQTKNTIRKELRFVVWWSTARTLPCNDIPEPKWRNISAKRELRLPASHTKRGSRFAVRSNPPFRRVVTPGRWIDWSIMRGYIQEIKLKADLLG